MQMYATLIEQSAISQAMDVSLFENSVINRGRVCFPLRQTGWNNLL